VEVLSQDGSTADIRLSAPSGAPLGVHFEVELGSAVGYWHPAAGVERTLVPDWGGRTTTSLVRSAPVGVLHDAAGQELFSWAADQPVDELTIKFGVSEERKSFVVDVSGRGQDNRKLVVRLATGGGNLASAVARLAGWMSGRIPEPALTVPVLATLPVYSSWYTFTQQISAELIGAEAELAVGLGCGMIFIDDGWQQLAHGRGYQGLGDWRPDEAKFPDLAAHVSHLHGSGAGVALWVAPLFLGPQSAAHAELERYAPYWSAEMNCRVLDPRYPLVREHLADTCLRLVTDYGVDGLKVDFLDTAMHYQGTETQGDIADVGVAMADVLTLMRRRLGDAGHQDVVFEFRQPYVNPAIARYGQILRASDCPADAVLNRQRTVDCRLLAAGQVVHSDPLMWGPTGGAAAVAQQVYSAMFSVPQISMRLSALPPTQLEALAGLLAFWSDHSEVLLTGQLQVSGSEASYTCVAALREDLGRAVVVAYASQVVDLDAVGGTQITVVNATATPDLAVRTGRQVTSATLHDARGRSTELHESIPSGLHEIPVEPWGSVTIGVGNRRS
jgi:alpha-galactosidase